MESESSEEWTSWTLDSKGIVRIEADEICKAYENFKKAKVLSETIACAKIGQELLLQQLVDIFYFTKNFLNLSITPDSSFRKIARIKTAYLIRSSAAFSMNVDAETLYTSQRLGDVSTLGGFTVDNFIRDLSLIFPGCNHEYCFGRNDTITDDMLDHLNLLLERDDPLSMCIEKAEEAYHRLVVLQMFDIPSTLLPFQDEEHISRFNIRTVMAVHLSTKKVLLRLMRVTNAEPEPLAFIDDHLRKIKLKSEHLNDLWILSTSRSCRGSVDVEVNVTPVVRRSAADGSSCITMKFSGLWVKPSNLELVTELNLTFAPLTIDPKCVVRVETELGSPNNSYDISFTEGATRSTTLNISTGPGPLGNTTSGTSNATTIKGTTKDWTHSQLKSRDRFYAFQRTFVTDQVAPESNYYSGTYCWKLESVAGKKLQEYLKPKRGWNFRPWIPKPNRHGKRIPRLSASGVSWNMDGSVNLTCEDYPKSIKWHLKDQDMNETMKWMVKLEIIVTDKDGATRRFILWSDSLEIPPSTINEEGSSSTMSKDEV